LVPCVAFGHTGGVIFVEGKITVQAIEICNPNYTTISTSKRKMNIVFLTILYGDASTVVTRRMRTNRARFCSRTCGVIVDVQNVNKVEMALRIVSTSIS